MLSSELVRSVLDSAPDAMIIIDAVAHQSRLRWPNP